MWGHVKRSGGAIQTGNQFDQIKLVFVHFMRGDHRIQARLFRPMAGLRIQPVQQVKLAIINPHSTRTTTWPVFADACHL